MTKTTILIVGGGPVGLILANILAKQHIDFKIIDKEEIPTTQDRAITITARTLEQLQAIDISTPLVNEGVHCFFTKLYYKKHLLGQLDLSQLNSAYNFILQIAQPSIVRILETELKKSEAQVSRPMKLLHFKKEENVITCEIENVITGEIEMLEADYLIACDGGHSTVRRESGVGFLGETIGETTILVDAEIKNFPLRYEERHICTLPNQSVLFILPLQRMNNRNISRIGLTRAGKHLYENNEDIVLAIKKAMKETGFENAEISAPIWITNFNPKQFVVEKLYKENIAFAGDAAHVQSPIGAQGLNTGAQDVFNLGWKLIFVIKHHFNKQLLDTYHEERHETALNLMKYNVFNSKITYSMPLFFRVSYLLLTKLNRIKKVNNKLIEKVSQLNLFYSSKNESEIQNLSDFKKGHRLPYIFFDQKKSKSIYDLIRIDKFLLVFFGNCSDLWPVVNDLKKHTAYLDVVVISKEEKNLFVDEEGITFICDKESTIHSQYKIPEKFICIVRPDSYIDHVESIISSFNIDNYFNRYK